MGTAPRLRSPATVSTHRSKSPGEQGRIPKPRQRPGAWRVLVEAEIARLRDELEAAGEPAPQLTTRARTTAGYFEAQRRIVEEQLERAERAVEPVGPYRSVKNWYSGAAVESAWTSLHRASEALVMIQSPLSLPAEFVDIQAAFEANVKPADLRGDSLA